MATTIHKSPTDYITEMKKEQSNFLDLTHQLYNYNTMYNLNDHLLKIHDREIKELTSAENKVKSISLKSRQKYFMLDYGANDYAMRSNLLYFTIVVVGVIIMLCASFANNKMQIVKFVLLVIGILIIWCIVVLLVVKYNSNRRRLAWNQFYWRSMNTKNTCS